jgi:ribose transport system ATP-binding protein
MSSEAAPFLEIRGVSKRYDATQALRRVDFSARSGEVHAIVGENGAGKSTLVKVVTGAVQADSGRILLEGIPTLIVNPLASQRLGIRVVHQHVSLVPHLAVSENILLGAMPADAWGWHINWRAAHRRAESILRDLGFDGIDVRRPVSGLSLVQRKLIEIAKACAVPPRLLMMDEPSAVLSHAERERLFGLIRRLKADATSIVYISHDLDEVLGIADRITVLRDGAVVGTVRPGDTDKRRIVEMMVGRAVSDVFPPRTARTGAEALRLIGLSWGDRFRDVSFSVARGEIVGLYGLIGSGRSEVARCIFGADRPTAGEIRLGGRPLRPRSPRDALKAGVAMLTEDRARDGLVLFLSTCDNVTLANFDRMSRLGVLARGRQRSLVESKVRELDVRPRNIDRPVRTLSGGNQQKVVLAKWLLARADVLILDEPTWGVDAGAKQEIYQVISRVAADGVAVLLISSELPEILGLSDRILVMRKGRVVGEVARGEATEQNLVARATGTMG